MFILTWLTGLLRHRAARLAGSILGVAMTVALLGSLGVFFAASKAQMTRQALAGVVVDWQVQLAPGAAGASAGRAIAGAPGVVKSLPVGYASTTGLTATAGGTTQVTGPGKVLGLPPSYSAAFPGEIRYLVGGRSGVLLAQQTAANLHASVGSLVAIGRKGLPPAKVVVRGIVDLPAADSMFQAVGAPPGVSLQAPPDNVVLLPQAVWQRDFTQLGNTQPGAVYQQYHVALSPRLAPDPAAAFTDVTARAKNLEVRLAGAGAVGDNLAAQLDAARKDALYAHLLFLFLGGPVAVVAGFGLAMAPELGPAARDAGTIPVRQARNVVGPASKPLWATLYVDIWLLAAAGIVFWRSVQSGYQVVLAPEGVATISVSYSTFLAPLLFWIGAALLSWRLSNAALGRGRAAVARAARPLAGSLAGGVAAAMSRHARLLLPRLLT